MAKFEKKDYFSTLVTLLMSCFLELTNAFNRTKLELKCRYVCR